MSQSFINNPEKDVVRNVWNTPILQYLHNTHQVKYRYFGLPGPNLIDIKLWKNMISEVIAFQLLDNKGNDDRASIKEIKSNLALLKSTDKIISQVYCGAFESTVLNQQDLDGIQYKQDKIVTLYNLDFCNEITSMVPTPEGARESIRFDALRQIFIDQKSCYDGSSNTPFLIFLTLRNEFNKKIVREYLMPASDSDAEPNVLSATKQFIDAANEQPSPLDGSGRVKGCGWALKAFMYEMFRGYFKGNNIQCLFFPMVKYIGTPVDGGKITSPMINWMILCKFGDSGSPSSNVYPKSILNKASMSVNGTQINESRTPGETFPSANDPVKFFRPYEEKFFNG